MDVLDVSCEVCHRVVLGSAESALVDAPVQLGLGQNLLGLVHGGSILNLAGFVPGMVTIIDGIMHASVVVTFGKNWPFFRQ